jgi:hypothetical protein
MKRVQILSVAAFATMLLTGCIHDPAGGSHVAYYDGAYGAYHGGFWGENGKFYYYTDASMVAVVRDDQAHFRPGAMHGFWQVTARPRDYQAMDRADGVGLQASAH